MKSSGDGQGAIDTSKPHPARMYDYYLGGKDSYPVDWEAAEQAIAFLPGIKEGARANRAFMQRASRLLAGLGVRQYLDIGTGIPTEPNLHQVVQQAVPDARVVYVDNDPIVLRHAEALLRGTPEGRTEYLQADVRDVDKIIEGAREILNFDRPVALSMVALLHFVSDEYDPRGLVRRLLEPLAPGSYLMLSHATGDFDPEAWARVIKIYRDSGVPAQVRSWAEFATFFSGLELIGPGVELVSRWYPEPGDQYSGNDRIPVYVGVARKT
ncbi:SAM-dependent methyltransferase [Streptomyces jumonjinensis]|uniref:SAM-dependent methyltransferase n=1 Tax=Streptomyces jumonjinensis TaxID=1945 RepID=A0A646KDY6_STRJU|nr:SAM-dependent methyltransferase [Streptomyces jumonjinensis]MQT00455.1 SAM-dependent methyltransferase [Streptomyces jumonjinensis]